jgi:transcriptional regulator with XRE-family HTH domain
MRNEMSDEAVLKKLGERLLQYRLNRNMTQTALAKEAGVSSRTINRVEHGYSIQLSNLIRLLRSLDLIQNLDALIPEPAPSPIQQMKLRGKVRKRASSSSKEDVETWSWEDDE